MITFATKYINPKRIDIIETHFSDCHWGCELHVIIGGQTLIEYYSNEEECTNRLIELNKLVSNA
jgi:hypothetical protein